MTLKLDMNKAYDRVEWSFLKNVMDFKDKWVQLIMMCVSSISYSFLVNGAPTGYVLPHIGLKQGNPLSSYLFLLCAEIFSSLITQAENQGLIHRVSICKGTPVVSHLLFTDDSFLFTTTSHLECQSLRDIFNKCETTSGQKINLEKSYVSFSMNVGIEEHHLLAGILRVQWVKKHDKYLGLPTFGGRSKTVCFNLIKERIWGKIQGWKEKMLSFAGK